MVSDDTVTTCDGCGAHRLSRRYKGLWLCLASPFHCYRHRKAIYANHRDEDRRSQIDEKAPV
ncbi:hypothetical protein LCGC14_1069890 [marine sediment metagenome]|uniref:Uncharacterized protein n=1 Tax=marine sediment metagenome TaxID=412755 RepID=A0A0F9MIM4_9ZZZZ